MAALLECTGKLHWPQLPLPRKQGSLYCPGRRMHQDLNDRKCRNQHDSCSTQYIVQTLFDLLSIAMSGYTDLMNDGYDAKFKFYADSVASNADLSVHDFVYENGNKYFTCKVGKDSICCSQCYGEINAYNCDLCWSDGACYSDCTSISCELVHSTGRLPKPKYKWKLATEPCPPTTQSALSRVRITQRGALDSRGRRSLRLLR